MGNKHIVALLTVVYLGRVDGTNLCILVDWWSDVCGGVLIQSRWWLVSPDFSS